MTTQHSTAPRRLRRRSDERVLGGVASGLGDYFNVDPILIRILLVASLVFGGLGLFLYLVAWVLVPDETSETSIAQRTLGGTNFGGGVVGGILAVIAAVFAVGILGSIVFGWDGDRDGGAFLLALIVIGVGAYLLRRDRDAVVAPAIPGASATDPGQPVT
jgi:phage shock protein PspC (stress-responsive transcriptional regulator)